MLFQQNGFHPYEPNKTVFRILDTYIQLLELRVRVVVHILGSMLG